MTTEDQELRAWLEERGMILTEEQDRQLRAWLEQNDARMVGAVGSGRFEVLIYRQGTGLSGAGESHECLAEAVRHAQLAFDLKILQVLRRRARVVGQA